MARGSWGEEPDFDANDKWWWIFQNPIGFVVLAAVIMGILTCLWFIFSTSSKKDVKNPPLIKAEGSYKKKPADPGGMQVPHKDKLIYQSLSKTPKKEAEADQVLPPPEKPLSIEEDDKTAEADKNIVELKPLKSEDLEKKNVLDVKNDPVPEIKKGTVQEKSAPTPVAQAPSKKPVEALGGIEPGVHEEDHHQESDSAQDHKEDHEEIAPKLNGKWGIQLGAVRSQQAAQKEKSFIETHYKDLLKNMKITAKKVDLGPSKGVYYRIQAIGVASKKDAQVLCQKIRSRPIKGRKMDCFAINGK